MQKVFIDTSCYLALFVGSEKRHSSVAKIFSKYIRERYQFFTSYYVLNELYTRLVYDFGKIALRKVQIQMEKAIKSHEIKILDVDEVMFNKSTETMIKFAEHKLSFVDASIYNLVKDYKIDEVFTLDSDFKKAGLKTTSF